MRIFGDVIGNDAARSRVRALIVAMGVACLVCIVARLDRGGEAPTPCALPRVSAGVMRCDGVGDAPRARAFLVGDKLDVNTAMQSDLESLRGVGPSLAQAILDERSRRGRFETIDALDDVPGIGEKTLAKLSQWLSVAPP